MTERPEDVRRRLSAIDEIGEVVGALRAIAAGHAAGAKGALAAISSYEAKVTGALVRLAAPQMPAESAGPGIVIVVGAAQGFCGAYPQRLVEATRTHTPAGAGLMVIGQRSAAMLSDVGITPSWSAELPASPAHVPDLASQLTDELIDRSETFPGPIHTVTGRDLPGQPVEMRRLWPPEPPERRDRAAAPPLDSPLTTLPPEALARALLAETLFAEVARALMEGLRVENAARVEAMARAQSNLKERRALLSQRYSHARQEQMTTEMIELTIGYDEG